MFKVLLHRWAETAEAHLRHLFADTDLSDGLFGNRYWHIASLPAASAYGTSIINQEIVRLEHTVQGFLDFARLPPPQRSPCDLGAVLRGARDLVRTRATDQRVAVALYHVGPCRC